LPDLQGNETVMWVEGRRMKRCRGCGSLFAFKHPGEWYCQGPGCQVAKVQRRTWRNHQVPRNAEGGCAKRKPDEERKNRPWSGVRAAELDAKLALAELREWMAQERAKW
jgi:hypothetical protein